MASRTKEYYDKHPAAKKKKTAYDKKYNARPGEKKRRAARNASRDKLEKEGRVRKGDGKDVHHKDGNPKNKSKSNLKVERKSKNRARK